MLNSLVSIIIPAYNRAGLIGETLDSVLAQTYRKWECIVVDDGSTDNTKEVVQRYVDKDPRFIIADRPDYHKPGGNGARNYGFIKSKGNYIMWLDSDDLLHPDYLQEQIDQLNKKPEANWVVCENIIFEDTITNRTGKLYESEPVSDNPLKSYVQKKLGIHTSSPVFRKRFLDETTNKSGLFKEDLKQSQEWELFCRLLFYDSNYLTVEKELLFLRKNPDSITTDYYERKPEVIHSQIKALKYIHDFLNEHDILDNDLKSFFVNSGITILKRLINANQNRDLINYCEQYTFNCLSTTKADRLYRIKYLLGKELWKKTKRGHTLLRYP